MIYMLDTDISSYIMRQHARSVLETLNDKASAGYILCISVISYLELRFGAERVGSTKYHQRIDGFCDRIDYVAEFTIESAEQCARLHATLLKNGTPIGLNDTMIAAHALSIDATLVTNNHKHFSQVDGLRLENWFTH